MKEIKAISQAANYSAVDFGKFNELGNYVLDLGDFKLPGKVFGGNSVGATGSEFSFQVFQAGQEGGFYHTHTNHEELYFFLAGKGEYQVDGENIPVQEGTVIRVAPAGKRTVRNTGTEPLVMLCVQYRANSLTADDIANDGAILQEEVKW